MTLLGFALAALIGLSLGLLGGGGSILTVPIFVYILGMEPKQAIGLSLAVVGVTSLVGAAGHWRDGNVRLRIALPFGMIAMVGTYTGARLAEFVSGTFQLVLFALVMLAAAVFMVRPSRVEAPSAPPPTLLVIGEALVVGVLTGLVGVGGGFLIVPALVLLGLPVKQAIGTSLVIIAAKSAAGFAGYLGQITVPWGFLAGFAGIAIMGIVVGTRLVRHMASQHLRQVFAVVLVVMAVTILIERTFFG